MNEQTNQINTRVQDLVNSAKEMTIQTKEHYEIADSKFIVIRLLKKQINEVFDPIIKKAHEAHKEANDQKKKFITPVEEAETLLKKKMRDYQNEQERIRQIEIAKLEAERKAEEKKLEEQRLAEAVKLEEKGADAFTVQCILDHKTPIIPIDTSALPELLKYDKRVFHATWKWKVVDESKIPDSYYILNEKMISAIVKTNKDKTDILGIEVYYE